MAYQTLLVIQCQIIFIDTFPDFFFFFVYAFKIVIDSWKLSMLLLYILWDDQLFFMISGLNEKLQQEVE